MKIITSYPVKHEHGAVVVNTILDGYTGIDGSSSKDEVKAFQDWANKNKGENLVVDGLYGPKTNAAYLKYAKEYDSKSLVETAKILKSALPVNAPTQKKGFSLSKNQIIGLTIAGAVLTVVVIRIIQKAKK